METTLIGAFSAVATAMTGLSGVLWKVHQGETKNRDEVSDKQVKAAYNMGRLEQRVDLLWEFLMKQARATALVGGLTTVASAEKLSISAISLYSPELVQKLKAFYTSNAQLPDNDLFQRIHETFGEELFTNICIPNKLFYGSCVATAVHIAKNSE